MLKILRRSDGECVWYLSRNIGELTPEKPKYFFPKAFKNRLRCLEPDSYGSKASADFTSRQSLALDGVLNFAAHG
jgi:hypothetical protein